MQNKHGEKNEANCACISSHRDKSKILSFFAH